MNSRANAESTVEEGIENTVMAIRERLMEYFKGSCTSKRIGKSNICILEEGHRAAHQYERELLALRNPCKLFIDEYVLMDVELDPKRATFYDKTLHRSKTMRAVKDGVERFFEMYLPSIEVKHLADGDSENWRVDRKLVMGNQVIVPAAAVPISPQEEWLRARGISLSPSTITYDAAGLSEPMLREYMAQIERDAAFRGSYFS